jgi:hypothetical protein
MAAGIESDITNHLIRWVNVCATQFGCSTGIPVKTGWLEWFRGFTLIAPEHTVVLKAMDAQMDARAHKAPQAKNRIAIPAAH